MIKDISLHYKNSRWLFSSSFTVSLLLLVNWSSGSTDDLTPEAAEVERPKGRKPNVAASFDKQNLKGDHVSTCRFFYMHLVHKKVAAFFLGFASRPTTTKKGAQLLEPQHEELSVI